MYNNNNNIYIYIIEYKHVQHKTYIKVNV